MIEKESKNSFYFAYEGEEEHKRHICESNVYFIEHEGEVVGTISYKINKEKDFYINGLTILPKYRGKGLGTKAMEKLLAKLKGKEVTLVVHPENVKAILIYLHLGFVITAWSDNHFGNGQPRIWMRKKGK